MAGSRSAIAVGLALAISLVAGAALPPAWSAPPGDWQQYLAAFVQSDGRVVDTGNGGISHSEGQAYALLLATRYGDHATFVRVWQWTRSHLRVRKDHLCAWKWTPAHGVEDRNNATDGDLVLAWALLGADRLWPGERWGDQGRAVARDIAAELVKPTSSGTLLLPGEQGFEHPDGDVVNLSYWVFPALAACQQADPDPLWAQVVATGRAWIRRARFGRWSLPPDWLALGAKPAPAPGFKPDFGYDAVRIPLYLMWARSDPADLAPFRAFWGYFAQAPFLPAWTHLTDDSVDSYEASVGIHAIADALMTYPKLSAAALPRWGATMDYYSASLLLLTRMMVDSQDHGG